MDNRRLVLRKVGKEVRCVMRFEVVLFTLLAAVVALAHGDGSTQKQAVAAMVEAGHAERNLLSSRKEMLGDGNSAAFGSKHRKRVRNGFRKAGKAVATVATNTVKSAYKASTKVLSTATDTIKSGVTHVHNKLKDKFGPNNDISWTEPKRGAKFGLALPGGGVKSIFAVWQIFSKYGGKIFSQAPLISTNSGSSWGVNQFLFTKKGYFSDDDRTPMKMRELLNSILKAAKNDGQGDKAFDLMMGMMPNIFSPAGPNWVEYMAQATHTVDGWNEMVDGVNRIASCTKPENGPKYGIPCNQKPNMDLLWTQHIVLFPQGSYAGPQYRYCPVGHKSTRRFGNSHGTFRLHNGYCQICTGSWRKKCRNVEKVPTSNVWTYEIFVDGSPVKYPTLPGYATKQTSDSASDKYELSFPYLDGKELSVTFSPLHGKGKGSHNYFFKSRGGNKMLHKDRIIQHKKVKFTYQKLQDKTEEYFDDLWDNNRERLSGISSSAAGLLNSKKMLETVKIKLFGVNLKFASNIIREMLDEDYDDEGVVIHGEMVKPTKGWTNLAQMIKNGGVMGIWPGVGAATQVEMKRSSISPLKFSFADGGYADNYGIAGHLRHMTLTGKRYPVISVLTIPSYKNFAQFFSKRFCKVGFSECDGTTKPIDDYGFASYDMPNLMMFEGLPFDGPPSECQKDPKKRGCKIVYPFKVDLTTVKNEVFGIKGGMKVKFIFLFFNPGDLTLLPSANQADEIIESALKLNVVLEKADVLKYFV